VPDNLFGDLIAAMGAIEGDEEDDPGGGISTASRTTTIPAATCSTGASSTL
jgi:hypothetical protein